MSQFELKLPGTVCCGEGALHKLTSILKDNYKKVVIFTDEGIFQSGILEEPLKYIETSGAEWKMMKNLPTEPSYLQAQEVLDEFYTYNGDIIVAIGGGSVMDIAKLASVIGQNTYKVEDVLYQPNLCKKYIPTVMIPTTAGTGSEATPNCIVTVPEREVKEGIVNHEMLADYVILDACMIKKLPNKIAASTGIDALAHALECYTSKKANPLSNLFAMEALKLIITNIEKACTEMNAMEEKEKMLLGSFYAGVAITASGTTAVHGLSYPLGGKYHIPHGIANAIMLLPVMEYNASSCSKEYIDICNQINQDAFDWADKEKEDWLLKRIESILKNLNVEVSLKPYGIKKEDVGFLVEAGMKQQRLLSNNKREVTPEAARELYLQLV